MPKHVVAPPTVPIVSVATAVVMIVVSRAHCGCRVERSRDIVRLFTHNRDRKVEKRHRIKTDMASGLELIAQQYRDMEDVLDANNVKEDEITERDGRDAQTEAGSTSICGPFAETDVEEPVALEKVYAMRLNHELHSVHARRYDQDQRRTQKATRWEKGWWVTDAGKAMRLTDMRSGHLKHLLDALERQIHKKKAQKLMTKRNEMQQELARRKSGESKEPEDKRYQPGMWLTKDGNYVKLSSMSTEHLKNAVNFLRLYGGYDGEDKRKKRAEMEDDLERRANPPAPAPEAPPAPMFPQMLGARFS